MDQQTEDDDGIWVMERYLATANKTTSLDDDSAYCQLQMDIACPHPIFILKMSFVPIDAQNSQFKELFVLSFARKRTSSLLNGQSKPVETSDLKTPCWPSSKLEFRFSLILEISLSFGFEFSYFNNELPSFQSEL